MEAPLTGPINSPASMAPLWECHIENDWLLVWDERRDHRYPDADRHPQRHLRVVHCTHTPNLPSDKQQAVPMVVVATLNTGAVPKELSSDAGYYSAGR